LPPGARGRRRDRSMPAIHTWSGGRQMVFVNHFYFYQWDPEWGAAFWKTNAYAPFPIWLWLNGHSCAQRQLEKASIGFEALDNGFRSCADPAALQRICIRLVASAVHTFF